MPREYPSTQQPNQTTSANTTYSSSTPFLQTVVEVSSKSLLHRRLLWTLHFLISAFLFATYLVLQFSISRAFQAEYRSARAFSLDYIFPLIVTAGSIASVPFQIALYHFVGWKRWVIIVDYAIQIVLLIGYLFAGMASLGVSSIRLISRLRILIWLKTFFRFVNRFSILVCQRCFVIYLSRLASFPFS
jgi:hypothetical protein